MDFKLLEKEIKDLKVEFSNVKDLNVIIEALLKKRARFIKERCDTEGFPDKYYVFNNELESLESEVFVIKPLDSKADIKAMEAYSANCSNKLIAYLTEDWLRGYTDYRCGSVRRGLCPILRSPICCAHCSENNSCVMRENTPMCSLVMLGDVVNREDCEEL